MRSALLIVLMAGLGISSVKAQPKEKQIGVSAQVYYSGRVWLKSADRIDSLNEQDKGFFNINPQIWFYAYRSGSLTLQLGLHYSTYGFQRRSKDLEFGDQPHPDLPRIGNYIVADPAYFDFYYRTHRINIPVLFNREIISLRKSISARYYFTPGFSLGYRIWDKTIAFSRGFGFDGKNRFAVNNVYQTNPFSAQLIIGGRIEYRLSAKYRGHIQPVLRIPLTSDFVNGEKAFLPVFGINFGLSVLTNKIDEKE